MNDNPDYSKYTFKELENIYHAVDRAKYPENFQAIAHELRKRTQELEILYAAAQLAYEKDADFEKALQLMQKIVDEYPGTDEARNSSVYIKQILDKRSADSGGAGDNEADLKLEFRGSAREYFRVWIVNLCLTLLTFGIFSAWAKVRKKRYFYSNLILDGTPFQYLAQPVPILKGRLVATILFLTYYSSSRIFTALFPYVLGAGLVLIPWVIVRSAAFNARYSAFRNMTFRFDGTYWQALGVISAWGIIPAIIVGTIFNWWGQVWAAGVLYALFGILFPWWMRRLKNFIVSKTAFGGHYGQFSATGRKFFNIYFTSGLILIAFSIVTGVTVMIASAAISDSAYMPFVFTIPIYIGYIFAYAYVQANITNTVWNGISLGPARFHCTLKTIDMVKLYLTNAVGIIASAGLLIPWAVVRTFRYRADHTHVINTGELSDFRGSEKATVRAAGAEVGEFFDMDLSL